MKIAIYSEAIVLNESKLLQTILLFNKKNNVEIVLYTNCNLTFLPENITTKTINNKSKLSKILWLKIKFTKLIQYENFDVFITDNLVAINKSCCTLQFLYLDEKNYNSCLKSNKHKLAIAQKVLVTDHYIADLLNSIATTNVIHYPIPQLQLSYTTLQKQAIKDSYSKGYDYILININHQSIQHIVTVLKAYSQFKKWQKTTIKLLLVVKSLKTVDLIPNFNTYKHRQDVFLIEKSSNSFTEITAAAYLQLFLSNNKYFDETFIAMQNNVPIIALDSPINNSFLGSAALYSQANDLSLYQQIEQVYKNEIVAKELQIHADLLLKKYDPNIVADNMLKAISES